MSGGRIVSSFACLLIVAAFHVPPAGAAAAWEDVPVPGGPASLAKSLAVDPVPDRARFMHEVTRLLYDTPEIRRPSVAAFLLGIRQGSREPAAPARARIAPSDAVPVPLDVETWSGAIFKRKIAPEQLVHAIVADRQAALLCHGLTKLDDETLRFLDAHPALLTRLYERDASLFAAFAAGIRIRDDRVVPPGDADATSLWEAVIDERVTRPERFVPALLEASDGRLAYIYDLAAALDPARRAFLLGAWMAPALRLERFRLLATAGVAAMREWHARLLPFSRSSYDFGMALLRLAVRDDGTPLPPASRGLWARVLGGGEPADDTPIDAAWLLTSFVATDVRQRYERLDTLTFAQRLAREASPGGDVEKRDAGPPTASGGLDENELLFVLRALPRYRALVLGLDRAGFRNPAVYAAAIRHASRLSAFDGRKGYLLQAQFQGSLALVARLAAVGTIDVSTGEQLIAQLAELPLADGYAGEIAHWIRTRLLPHLPASRDVESAIIAGIAGVSSAVAAPRVTWEGQVYRLDLAAAERQRLERVREKQRAPRLDFPLQLAEAARQLNADSVTIDDLQDAAMQFEALAADLPRRSREEDADSLPAGVALPPAPYDLLRKAADELGKAAKSRDPKRAAKIAQAIVEVADDLLGRNLLSLVYAISLGDPDGTVLLATDVSHRHDFGFGVKDTELRARVTWAIPRQEVAPGVPWHVSGSLLGLDAGLATLVLRRVATDHVLEAPKLTNNARETFAASVALMDPNALHDVDRNAIAEAIARGRDRAGAATSAPAVAQIADAIGLDSSRRHALEWTIAHEPDRALSMYSLAELLVLGGGDPGAVHAWGMAVLPAAGCLCSRLELPAAWAILAGRPQLGLEAAIVSDLNLRIAVVLKELDLPAALAKVILSGAMQDLLDEARPTDDSDWLSVARAARAVTRERVEDYVAAATATGPLMPEPTRSPQPER